MRFIAALRTGVFHPGSSLGLRRQACPLPWAGAESQRPRVQALASSTCGGSLPWKWVFAGVVKLGGGRGGRVEPDPDACLSEKRGSGTGGRMVLDDRGGGGAMLLETRGARDLGRHRKQERGLGRRNQLCRLWASELGGVCVCPDVTRRPGHVALSPRPPGERCLAPPQASASQR